MRYMVCHEGSGVALAGPFDYYEEARLAAMDWRNPSFTVFVRKFDEARDEPVCHRIIAIGGLLVPAGPRKLIKGGSDK